MTVAHDAATESGLWSTTPDPFTFSHTPAGTPRGVLVLIAQEVGSNDDITGVTYGGVAMARVAIAQDGAGEQGAAYAYFLGSGIPTGVQTVSIDHGAAARGKWAVCVTVTAASDTEIGASGVIQADQTNPQIALSTTPASLRYCVIYSAENAASDLSLLASHTAVHDEGNLFGNECARVDRQTTASSGSFTIGYTAGPNDVAMCAVAVQEAAGGGGGQAPRSMHQYRVRRT